MATIPVYSPTIPFLGLVPGGLRPGSMVRIKGVINNHGERCQINIQTGAALNPRDDVVFHLSIRPNESVIVRNTLQNQVWGAEERWGGCPIAYGQQFDLLVLAEVNQWKIAVNGNHLATFSHRLPVHSARYVSISGGCVIHSITAEMDSGAGAGGAAPPYPGTVPGGSKIRLKRMQLPDGTLMETSVFRGRCWVRRACQRSCMTMNLRRAKPVETDQPSEPFPALAKGSRRSGLSSISWWGQPFQCGSLQKGLSRNGREVYAGNRKAALLVASSLKEQRSTVVATWKWPLLSLSWPESLRAKAADQTEQRDLLHGIGRHD